MEQGQPVEDLAPDGSYVIPYQNIQKSTYDKQVMLASFRYLRCAISMVCAAQSSYHTALSVICVCRGSLEQAHDVPTRAQGVATESCPSKPDSPPKSHAIFIAIHPSHCAKAGKRATLLTAEPSSLTLSRGLTRAGW